MAHRDERRHAQFGIALVRRILQQDPEAADRFVANTEKRTAKLATMDGIDPADAESLTVIAAGSISPKNLRDGSAAVAQLLKTMHEN